LPVEFNLADLFESVADAVPDREAVVCGDRRLTYAELDRRANRLAHHLLEAGIGPGDHLGLYLYNGTEYVEAMLACAKVRAVSINVNYRYVEDELRYLFDNADLVAAIHSRSLSSRLRGARTPKLQHLVMVEDGSTDDPGDLGSVEYEDALAAASPDRGFEPRSADDLFVIYTGGTTGMPRGVMWRQEDLFFTALGGGNPMGDPIEKPEQLAENAAARSQVVQFPVPPLIHGAAQLGVLIGLFWGDKVVLVPRFDARAVWQAVAMEKVNSMTIVGDAMARPLAEVLESEGDSFDLSTLVYIGSTGAVLTPEVKEQLSSLLPNAFVAEHFGSTETGFQGTEAPGPAPEGGGLRFMMSDRSTVLDDDLKPVEPGSGVVGKLARKGRLPLGYYKDEEKTRQAFVEVGGERWAMQGDLATIELDGTIVVFGRGAVCINSGGEKIYPEEVERALKSHPDVYDAVVVGVPDERWGERVAAVVQPRPGTSPTLEELDGHCREHISGYKVPREVHLVDELVRQPSGKPDYPWAKRTAAEAAMAGS
jgi:acyl-CoA synthetase (AMP-forming)/AMP-acid ligase II